MVAIPAWWTPWKGSFAQSTSPAGEGPEDAVEAVWRGEQAAIAATAAAVPPRNPRRLTRLGRCSGMAGSSPTRSLMVMLVRCVGLLGSGVLLGDRDRMSTRLNSSH